MRKSKDDCKNFVEFFSTKFIDDFKNLLDSEVSKQKSETDELPYIPIIGTLNHQSNSQMPEHSCEHSDPPSESLKCPVCHSVLTLSQVTN